MNTTIYIIKAKYANVKSTAYVKFNVKNNVKDPKFKVGDHVRMSKYRTLQLEWRGLCNYKSWKYSSMDICNRIP